MTLFLAAVTLCAAKDFPPASETHASAPDAALAESPEPSALESFYTQPLDEDPKDKPVLNKWTGTASFGGSVWNGNTNRKAATALVDASFRREDDRFTLKFYWSFAEETTGVTDRQTYGSFKYDYFLSKKSYLFGIAEAGDSFTANLKLRSAVGGGYGYQWVEDKEWNVSTEIGAAWYREDYTTADPTKSYVAARGAYKVEYKPTEKWLLSNAGEIYQSVETEEDTSSKMLTRARYNFTEKMFVEGIWAWAWDNTPATGAVRNDNIYTLNIGFAF
jgi:putative salt-induced outer membrane protein YdiY